MRAIPFVMTFSILQSYANGNLSFIAVQRGRTFTEPPSGVRLARRRGAKADGVTRFISAAARFECRASVPSIHWDIASSRRRRSPSRR